MNYIAQPISRKEIRDLARFIRRIQNSESTVYFDIMDFLEHTLPRIFPEFSLSIGTKEEMGECHGLTFPDKNEIRLRADVYEGAMKGNGRDRLTAAHELFHFLTHSKANVVFARMENGKVPAYMDPEWQADAFGGELLIPYDSVQDLTVDQIREKCGVSEKAAQCQYRKIHGM